MAGDNKMQQNFDKYSAEYQDIAKNMITSGELSNKVKPQDYTKEDVNSIAAKGYYDDPNAMITDRKEAYSSNENTKALTDLQINGKQTIDPNNPAYKHASETQDNADKILHDETGSDYQCTEVSTGCTTETTTKTCQQSNHQDVSCMRYPQVQIVETIVDGEQVSFKDSIGMGRASHSTHRASSIIPYSGTLKSLKLTFTLWSPIQGYTSGYQVNFLPVFSGYTGQGSGQRSWTLNFNHLSSQLVQGQRFNIEIQSLYGSIFNSGQTVSYEAVLQLPSKTERKAVVTWVDTCSNLQTSACVKTSEVCTEAGGTRNISGIDVTLPCWRYDLSYSCGYNKVDSCKPLEDICNFVSQRCIEQDSGFCLTYEKTYNCIQQDCEHKELRCGAPNSITFDQKIPHGTANDFAKAVAGFAGISAAGNDLKETQDKLQIFKGYSNDCGEAGMGLYDCCDGGGNILRNCSESEKALKEAREKKLASFIGRFCAKKELGICLVYHQSWCVFDSKLTRIIQEQGRVGQLHIPFGSAENPSCNGLTPEQLQQINFDKIDFSEIYADMSVHNPADQSIEKAMGNKFQQDKQTPQYQKKKTKEAQDHPLNDEDIKYKGA